MSPTRFAVNFSARPAVKILGKVQFDLKGYDPHDIRLAMQDLFVKDSAGVPYPTGVQVTVETWAESKDEAIAKAAGWASGSIAIMSFISDIGMPSFRPETAFDITAQADSRDFIQFFWDLPVVPTSNGALKAEIFSSCFGKLVDANTKNRDRLQRAIGRYSKALTETNVIDQFSSVWIGLEALNGPLRERLNARDKITKCPKCGFERTIPTLNGVKKFLTSNASPDGSDLFGRARSIRVDIEHSTKNLEGLLPEIAALVPDLRRELRKAIFFLLELPIPEPERAEPITNVAPFHTAIEAKIVGAKDIEALRSDFGGPHLEVSGVQVESHVEGDQTVTFSVRPTLIGQVTDSARFEVYATRMYGEKGKMKSGKFSGPMTPP